MKAGTVRSLLARGIPMQWTRKHLLGLEELSAAEIQHVFETAARFKEVSTRSIKKVPALQGRTVVNMFYESSTRTNLSFQLAARRLSADTLAFSKQGTSVSKGETLVDTARNIEAMGVDIMVLRHQASGALTKARFRAISARRTPSSVQPTWRRGPQLNRVQLAQAPRCLHKTTGLTANSARGPLSAGWPQARANGSTAAIKPLAEVYSCSSKAWHCSCEGVVR